MSRFSSSSDDMFDQLALDDLGEGAAEMLMATVQNVVKAIADDEGTSEPPKRRKYIIRERETGNELLVRDYFSPESTFDERSFRRRFRMSRNLFLRITNDLENKFDYFKQRPDARGQMGFTAMQKVTAALRSLAYGMTSDIMDEYLRMAERTASESTHFFCACVIDLYLKRYLRKPTFSDVHQLLEFHEEKHGFPGMLGSIDCMKWEWQLCPTEWQSQHASGFHKTPC